MTCSGSADKERYYRYQVPERRKLVSNEGNIMSEMHSLLLNNGMLEFNLVSACTSKIGVAKSAHRSKTVQAILHLCQYSARTFDT